MSLEGGWAILGISRLKGPKPNKALIENRGDVAIKLLTEFGKPSAIPEVARYLASIQSAMQNCLAELETVLLERRTVQSDPKGLPKWQEVEPCLILAAQEALTAAHHLPVDATALQLSNIHNITMRSYKHMEMDEARELQGMLSGPMEKVKAALSRYSGRVLLTWAPRDKGQCARIANAYNQLFQQQLAPKVLALVTTFESYAGVKAASNITDVWGHCLMDPQWELSRSGIQFLSPPAPMIFEGTHGPIHSHKGLAIFSFGLDGVGPAPPVIHNWRQQIYSQIGACMILKMDVPKAEAWDVKCMIPFLEIPGFKSIEGPSRSLGNSLKDPRSTLTISLVAGEYTPLRVEFMCKWLNKKLAAYSVLVGSQITFSSGQSKLLSVTCPAAATAFTSLFSGALVVSPAVVMIETNASQQQWVKGLTDQWMIDPSLCAEQIRYRPSEGTTTPFAKVQATSHQMATARAKKVHGEACGAKDNPSTLRVEVKIPVGLHANWNVWINTFMTQVESRTNLTLTRVLDEDKRIEGHEWRPILNFREDWTGRVLIQLKSADEVKALYKRVHGLGVSIEEHHCATEVCSKYIDLHNLCLS